MLRRRVISTVRRLARHAGFDVVRYPPAPPSPPPSRAEVARGVLQSLRDNSLYANEPEVRFFEFCAPRTHLSNAQLFQDLFVLFQLSEKRNGYFVEFGACDGVYLSNTYQLELRYGWSGIVAEPARTWHSKLTSNRKCAVDLRCVWNRTGDNLIFNETENPEQSAINSFAGLKGRNYTVPTVSLNDLLSEHNAPRQIDYLSVDTEGSELEVLRQFDFVHWRPHVITVEHNFFEPRRSQIRLLMANNGYHQVLPEVSFWDDWYVHSPR
jgi:FkbM family methyltransferase